jgi:hypothetical protein
MPESYRLFKKTVKLRFKLHKLINSIWNKEELSAQRNEYIIVPLYKKDDETDCSNYRGTSLLSTAYKRLCQYMRVDKITRIWDHQCGF